MHNKNVIKLKMMKKFFYEHIEYIFDDSDSKFDRIIGIFLLSIQTIVIFALFTLPFIWMYAIYYEYIK